LVRNIAFFTALLATSLASGAALAHLLELPNKIGMSAEQYFTVQQAYRGWDRLAFLLVIELASMIAVAILYWRDPPVRWAALGAIACLVVAQIIFWSFTYPANVATSNWTSIPNDWQRLRRNWEYSHAAGAIFQCLAMAGLIVAALSRRTHG
jgi:hypothetical protein